MKSDARDLDGPFSLCSLSFASVVLAMRYGDEETSRRFPELVWLHYYSVFFRDSAMSAS